MSQRVLSPPPGKKKIQAPAPGQIPEYAPEVIVYAVIAHQTNISYINGVPVCKACENHMVGRTASAITLFYSLRSLVFPILFQE